MSSEAGKPVVTTGLRPALRDGTVTYPVLNVLGWIGLGMFGWGLLDAYRFWSWEKPSDLSPLVIVAQCGFGMLIAAVAFGLAQIAFDVRNRIAPRAASDVN